MTPGKIRTFALMAAGLAGVVAWSQLPPPQPLALIKMSDELHVLEGSGGNVAVLTTAEGTILIDDKFAPNVPQIFEAAKKLSDKPIRYLFNTHHHGDHTGGNAGLMAKEPIEILLHENARANMVKGNQPGVPRVAYKDEMSVELGGVQVKAMHLGRGHTNGDVVIFLPKLRVVHMGDLFSVAGPFADSANGGSAVEWVKTLDRALALDFDRAIPGHGPISTKADLREYRNKMNSMVTQMQSLKSKGVSKEDAVKAIDVKALGWDVTRTQTRVLPVLYDEVGK